jgi:thiamine-phosphate pyrophosphorylase
VNTSVLRILDANLNRAREGLRVIEDYARFALDDDRLCQSLKQIRHDLVEATRHLSADAVLHRDTPGDVGTAATGSLERSRDDTAGVVVAAGKRLGEELQRLKNT